MAPAQAVEETAAVAAEEREGAVAAEGVGGAFGCLGGLACPQVVQDDQHLVQFLHFQLLGRLGDLALLLDDAAQRQLIPVLPTLVLVRYSPPSPPRYTS